MLLIIVYEKLYCQLDYEKPPMLLLYKNNIEGCFVRAYY